MKKQSLLQIFILVAIIILNLISFALLPDNVAVQWNTEGASNYVPKTLAILIPVVVSLFGLLSWKYSAIHYKNIIKFQKIHSMIWGTVSFTGIFISILFIIMN